MIPSSLISPGVLAAVLLLFPSQVVWAQPDNEPPASHGYLGIVVGPGQEGAKSFLVQDVTPNGPADKSGLKKGDRIMKLDGEEVQNIDNFLRAVAAKKPGGKIKLEVLRDDKKQTFEITLGERPGPGSFALPDMPGFHRPAFLGVQTQALTPEVKKHLNVEVEAGVLVTEVVPNFPAAKAGLKRDDVITAVGDQPVKTPPELRESIQKAGAGKSVTLQVVRGKEKLSVKATLREGAFGYYLTPGEDRFPTVDVESMLDQGRRIRELERRIEELEKRVRELEKK